MPGFTLASAPGLSSTLTGFSHARETRYGMRSGPATMHMLGGYFRFDPANEPLLVRLLPALVHIRREEAGPRACARRRAEVAERVGYQSAGPFSTAFTRLTGCPPSAFARVRTP